MTDYEAGALWFVLIVAAVILWLVYDRLRHPKARCWCQGGRIYSWTSNRWRDHTYCKGTGIRDNRR